MKLQGLMLIATFLVLVLFEYAESATIMLDSGTDGGHGGGLKEVNGERRKELGKNAGSKSPMFGVVFGCWPGFRCGNKHRQKKRDKKIPKQDPNSVDLDQKGSNNTNDTTKENTETEKQGCTAGSVNCGGDSTDTVEVVATTLKPTDELLEVPPVPPKTKICKPSNTVTQKTKPRIILKFTSKEDNDSDFKDALDIVDSIIQPEIKNQNPIGHKPTKRPLPKKPSDLSCIDGSDIAQTDTEKESEQVKVTEKNELGTNETKAVGDLGIKDGNASLDTSGQNIPPNNNQIQPESGKNFTSSYKIINPTATNGSPISGIYAAHNKSSHSSHNSSSGVIISGYSPPMNGEFVSGAFIGHHRNSSSSSQNSSSILQAGNLHTGIPETNGKIPTPQQPFIIPCLPGRNCNLQFPDIPPIHGNFIPYPGTNIPGFNFSFKWPEQNNGVPGSNGNILMLQHNGIIAGSGFSNQGATESNGNILMPADGIIAKSGSTHSSTKHKVHLVGLQQTGKARQANVMNSQQATRVSQPECSFVSQNWGGIQIPGQQLKHEINLRNNGNVSPPGGIFGSGVLYHHQQHSQSSSSSSNSQQQFFLHENIGR